MEKTPKLILGLCLAVVIFLSLGLYAYLQSREFLQGPVLTMQSPENGALATTSFMVLQGTARNVSFLTLNGRQIFTDEQGRFREPLLLSEGYNIMLLEAKDRFGHTDARRLELVYKPTASPSSAVVPASPFVIPADAGIQSP